MLIPGARIAKLWVGIQNVARDLLQEREYCHHSLPLGLNFGGEAAAMELDVYGVADGDLR